MNGVFVGVGVIFLIWGITDIAFPITERMNVAVFGLTRIILGIISLSIGIGIESIQWAKIEKEPSSNTSAASDTSEASDASTHQPQVEVPQPNSQ